MCDYDTPDLLLPPPLDYPSPLVGGILVAPPLWPQAPPPPFQDQFAEHAFDSIRLALAILKSEVTNNNNIASPSSPPCPSSCQGESMRIGASQVSPDSDLR